MGGSSSQVASKIELPEWVDKQAQSNMSLANELATKPFQTYGNQRIAGWSPDQANAFGAIRSGMGAQSGNLASAMKAAQGVSATAAPMVGGPNVDWMQKARGGSIGAGHTPGLARPGVLNFGMPRTGGPEPMLNTSPMFGSASSIGALLPALNGGGAPISFPSGNSFMGGQPQAEASTVDPAGLERVNAERVAAERFTDAPVIQYLNQYRQAALDPTLAEIQRQGDIMLTGNAARATGSGAFGGSRAALLDAETQKNILAQLAKTEAEGMAGGFDTASGLVQRDQDRALTAGLANQSTGLDAAKSNQNVTTQAQFRNQDALNTIAQLNAKLRQESNLANQDAMLKKMGLDIQSAGQQGELAKLSQDMSYKDIAALMGIGKEQQGMDQANMDLAYQDFLREQNHPQENLNMLISALNQSPYGRTTYGPGPNTAAQVGGGALSLAGLLSMFMGK